MEEFFDIHRDRGHNSHGYGKSRLGCFNGSLYICSFPRSMGKKWTLKVLLIAKSNCIVFGCKTFFLFFLFHSSDYQFLSGSILSTRKNIDIVVVQWDTTHNNILPHNKIVPRGSHPTYYVLTTSFIYYY